VIVPRDSRVIRGSRTGPPGRWNTNKGFTLSTWLKYVLCGAQQTAGQLGYSPLPYPLVTGGFLQFSHIPGHITAIPSSQLNNCNNPTYHDGVNFLTRDAPQPSPCDYYTAPLNCKVVVKGGKPTAVQTSGPGTGGTGGTGTGGTGTGGTGTGGTGTGNGTGRGTGNGSGTTINPNTGQVTGANGNSPGSNGSGGPISAQPVSLTGPAPQEAWLFGVLIVLALLGVIGAPTVLGSWLERRRTADASAGPQAAAPPAAGPPSEPPGRQ
jgi:hypothetical protein